MRAAFAGFLAGIAVVAALTAALRPHAGPRSPASDPARGASTSESPAAAALRSRAESLRAENERLAAALEPLRTRAGQAAGPAKKARRPRRELGADLLRRYAGGDGSSSLANGIRMELALLAGDVAERDGVTVGEAKLSPEALAETFLGMREATEPPMGEAERVAMDAALEAFRKDWEGWRERRREDMSFERMRTLLEAQDRARTALYAALDPAVAGTPLLRTMDGLDNALGPRTGDLLGGTLAEAIPALARQWITDLGLDESAAAALALVAEEFIRGDENRVWKIPDDPAGHKVVRDALRNLRPLARAQQRIREVAHLSEDQAKRLAAWWKYYYVKVQDEEPPGGGTEEGGEK